LTYPHGTGGLGLTPLVPHVGGIGKITTPNLQQSGLVKIVSVVGTFGVADQDDLGFFLFEMFFNYRVSLIIGHVLLCKFYRGYYVFLLLMLHHMLLALMILRLILIPLLILVCVTCLILCVIISG
jgi:hypothetical protein